MNGPPDPSAFLVVANADAGSADDERLEEGLAALREGGAEIEVARTGSADEVRTALRGLDTRVAVAAGGDGTLHVVAQALHDFDRLGDATVGLLPLGTGNDFARAAGIPLEPEDAGRLLVTAPPRSTDLVVDDRGTVVVNASHAGVGADASKRAADLKERFGVGAYAVGALLEGATTDGFRATVEVDGEVLVDDEAVLLLGVGNGVSIGGGTPLFPEAVLDDGRVEVVACLDTGLAARIGFGNDLRAGEHVDRDDVRTARGTDVVVRGEAVRHCLDGEVSEARSASRYRLQEGGWRVARPA